MGVACYPRLIEGFFEGSQFRYDQVNDSER